MSVTAAIISAAAALGATALSASANKKSAEQQRDYNVEQWEREQEYNSPENQLKRLRAAGFNPAFAMQNGSISSGNATSPAESYDRPNYDFSPVAHGVSQSLELYNSFKRNDSEIRLIDSQAESQSIRNKTQLLRDWTEISKLANDSSLSASQREYFSKQSKLLEKQINAFDAKNAAEVDYLQNQSKTEEKRQHQIELQIEYQRIVNQFAPSQQKKLLQQIDANIDSLLSAAYANNEKALLDAANRSLVGVDELTKKQLLPHLIDEAKSKADEAYWNSQQAGKRLYEGKGAEMLPSSYIGDDGRVYPRSYNRRKESHSNGGVR